MSDPNYEGAIRFFETPTEFHPISTTCKRPWPFARWLLRKQEHGKGVNRARQRLALEGKNQKL